MKLICANFKMNLTRNDIKNYLNVIKDKVKENVIFFPTSLYLNEFKEEGYEIGSQDISFKDFGSVTGDTSVLQLKDMGISYTIIGHSERREYFNDSKYVNQKINLALKNNIKVVLCIGENLNEFESNQTITILKKELDDAINNNLDLINRDNLIIAYEPIWAIGTGKIPTKDILNKTIFKKL